MWLPVDLVLAALLSSAFELAWVAERGGLSADGDPSDLDTDSSYVPALAPSPAPAFSSRRRVMAQARTAPRIPVRVALAVGAVVVLTVAPIGGWLLLRPSGHTAPTAGPAPATAQGDPVPGPNQARLMRMLPSGRSPGSCEPATTPPRALAKIVCTHNGDPAGPTAATYTLSPKKLRYGRFSTISRAAQPSSRARETSVARTPAPQRHAPASQRHAGVQLRPRGGHLDHRGQPARQRRPWRSSWAGAQPALPMMVGALLTPCDQGRHDGCPHRLGGRQEGGDAPGPRSPRSVARGRVGASWTRRTTRRVPTC